MSSISNSYHIEFLSYSFSFADYLNHSYVFIMFYYGNFTLFIMHFFSIYYGKWLVQRSVPAIMMPHLLTLVGKVQSMSCRVFVMMLTYESHIHIICTLKKKFITYFENLNIKNSNSNPKKHIKLYFVMNMFLHLTTKICIWYIQSNWTDLGKWQFIWYIMVVPNHFYMELLGHKTYEEFLKGFKGGDHKELQDSQAGIKDSKEETTRNYKFHKRN